MQPSLDDLKQLAGPAVALLHKAEALTQSAEDVPPTVAEASRRVLNACRNLCKTLSDPRPPQVKWREKCLAQGLCARCGQHKIAETRSGKLCRGCLNRLRDQMRTRRERAVKTPPTAG